MADHGFQVKVALSAEEYLALKSVADDIGTTQSGLLRMLAKLRIKEHVQSMRTGSDKSMDQTGHDMPNESVE
jgi:DNA-binding MarR family transcriptional regulator